MSSSRIIQFRHVSWYNCSTNAETAQEYGLTQEKLAERLGASVNFIGHVERGTNAPSFETLQKIAEVLGVSVREFFDFPEDKKD
jgi:transcriptional regulator with XRE-family HTH domain